MCPPYLAVVGDSSMAETYKKTAPVSVKTLDLLKKGVDSLLNDLGDFLDADSIWRTPERVAQMYLELLNGYNMTLDSVINGALFNVEYDEMVVVRDIRFYSMCEHHLLPFHGAVHVGYLPNGKIIGLSKLPRIVQMYAQRLQVQEKLTVQISEAIEEVLGARGVGVVVQAYHLCTAARGIEKPTVHMHTSAMRGTFRNSPATRQEFMRHIAVGANL